MSRKTSTFWITLLGALFFSQTALGTFIPPEDIKNPYQVFSERDANMTKAEFNDAIDKAEAIYAPIVQSHGARLVFNRKWDDDTLNASASQSFNTWNVNMYGGLARHPEMTLDGFSMVVCHELGHHLAGFTFKKSFWGGSWASNEGQSDYFAAHSCARELWKNELVENAKYRGQLPQIVADRCDQTWSTVDEQNLCYRINAGGESLSRVLSALKGDKKMPEFHTPDKNKVSKTNSNHPDAQCRMDTTYAASVCTVEFDPMLIPGKGMSDQFGKEAELEAAEYTCMEVTQSTEGLRPRCWFKPGV